MKKLLFVLSFLLLNCSQNQESITIDSPNIYTEVKSEISLSIDLLDRTTGTIGDLQVDLDTDLLDRTTGTIGDLQVDLDTDLLLRTTGTGPAVSVIIPVILHIIDSNNQ